jgi:RNA polymerase sigma-70 factor (ECF subfamily)
MHDTLAMTTTTQLLEGLRDPRRQDLWGEFDARFRPIIVAVARRAGLTDDDAEEAAQRTLLDFLQDYRSGKYERAKGRLRTWILGIARHRIADIWRERQRRLACRGESAFLSLAADEEWDGSWQAAQEKRLAELAWAELREATKTTEASLEAFQLFALRGQPAAEVAQQCGLATADVYRIKYRLTRRLQEIMARLRLVCEDGM